MKKISWKDMLLGFFVGVTTCLLSSHFSGKMATNVNPVVLIPTEIGENSLKTIEIVGIGRYNGGNVITQPAE